ncbi:MAG: 2Fe-2S iron-sulfur cluster binding domain-containing protein [Gammaproteobacteria bacterium]|nr:2Fe-2S iron-sulfur cluster binding domain-containing protein [Gammaproteobacteria bacterium]
MPELHFEGETYECRSGETVLDALLRCGVNLPFSCRNGICQVCLHRCTRGVVPEQARPGLRPTLRAQGYFLPCKCIPEGDMEIAPPREADLFSPAVVYEKTLLAPDVCRLLVEPATALYYHAGQFVNLRRADGLTRSYSLASVPQEDYFLEFHVKRIPGGVMSTWIFDELRKGEELEIHGPHGSGYYVGGCEGQDLLLIATGTGLAPLIGVARDALQSGHRGRIHLYHGSHAAQGLYLNERLLELAMQYPSFRYTGCVSGPDVPPGHVSGRVHKAAFGLHEDLRGWRVYLAGLPQMVRAAEARAARLGADPSAIHADPFEFHRPAAGMRPAASSDASVSTRAARGESTEFVPDPELWAALGEGALMSEILTDFYTRVFEDPLLAPYFQGVTKRRLIEKVYSFMRQSFTGERIYFGDRPRNAHHWMVISDELFDYREELMVACLRRHGVPEHLITRWRAVEERFRRDIVKTEPWSRVVNGVELPLEGFGEETLEVGTLCDGCKREIDAGEHVRYHLRLGTTYCNSCTAP